jgi:hypothetical protein
MHLSKNVVGAREGTRCANDFRGPVGQVREAARATGRKVHICLRHIVQHGESGRSKGRATSLGAMRDAPLSMQSEPGAYGVTEAQQPCAAHENLSIAQSEADHTLTTGACRAMCGVEVV